jgi:hypothetical protein
MPLVEQIDPREVMVGSDGCLFVQVPRTETGPGMTGNDAEVFMAHVDQFTIRGDFTNSPLHPVGQKLRYKIPVAWEWNLTLQETIVVGYLADLLAPLIMMIKGNKPIYFNFTGKVTRPDTDQVVNSVKLVNCVPDGSVDLMAIQPEEIIRRPWAFAVNANPIFQPLEPAVAASIKFRTVSIG